MYKYYYYCTGISILSKNVNLMKKLFPIKAETRQWKKTNSEKMVSIMTQIYHLIINWKQNHLHYPNSRNTPLEYCLSRYDIIIRKKKTLDYVQTWNQNYHYQIRYNHSPRSIHRVNQDHKRGKMGLISLQNI